MGGARFVDLDAAWRERAAKPLKLRVMGETVTLPAALPLAVAVKVARFRAELADADDDADMPVTFVVELLEASVGPDLLQKWMDAGMDVEQMGDVFQEAYKHWTAKSPNSPTPTASQ